MPRTSSLYSKSRRQCIRAGTIGDILYSRRRNLSGAWYRCACLYVAATKLIFFAACCMLPSAAKTFVKQTERKPLQLSAFIVSSLCHFSLDETKQNPSFKEMEETVYFFGSRQYVPYPTHKDICALFKKKQKKNALLGVVFKFGSDSVYKMHSSNTWGKKIKRRQVLWCALLS